MRCQWILPVFAVFCLSANFSVRANLNSDLNHFFNNLGYSSNVTSPQVYQGQQAGFYTGGSLYARNSVRDVQIGEVQLPSFRSGCGGIDLYTGGFSFINSQQLVSMMRSILNNTAGYAFNLALEEATPELANVMKYMNSLASEVNRMNINSCETAAGLVGSVWPKTHEAQRQVCQDIGANQGIFSDYAAARQGCGMGGGMSSTLDHAPDAYKSMALKNTNIAWKALQQNNFLQNDPELAQFFMSLSGTIVINNPGGTDRSQNQFKALPSLADDPQLLKALLQGGEARIYRCDDVSSDGCLHPSVHAVSVNQQNALRSQVSHLLSDMVDKIHQDKPLTREEIGLLNATRLPIYKMLNVQTAFAGDSTVSDIQNYADVIATDILFQYLDECLTIIKTGAASLQYPENLMMQFDKNIDLARDSVRNEEKNTYAKINMAAQLIEQTQVMEKMLAGNLSSNLINTLTWAQNLREIK